MPDEIETIRKLAARAATDPAFWPETLHVVGQAVGSEMTLVEVFDKQRNVHEIGFNDRPDIIARTREAYETYYCRKNLRWDAMRRLPPGSLFHDDLIGDDKELGRSEFYVDFLEPSGIKYFIGAALLDDGHHHVALAINRSAGRGRAKPEELEICRRFLPDLRNAMALYMRARHLPSSPVLADALDRLADPMAIVAVDGHAEFINRSMTGLIEAGDLVAMLDGRITPILAEWRSALGKAMQAAAQGGTGAATAPRHGWSPLIFRAVALGGGQAVQFTGDGKLLYCLMIDDPARPHWPSVEQAMSIFRLTRREAMVGCRLATGQGVDEIGRDLGISRNTVRTHLALVRDKLGAHSSLSVAVELRRAIDLFA